MAQKRELKKSERVLLYAGGGFAVFVMLWYLWLGPMRDDTIELRTSAQNAKGTLAEVRGLKADYIRTQAQINKYQEVIKARPVDFSLSDRISQIENNLHFSTSSTKPGAEQVLGVNGEYRKQSVKNSYVNKTLEEIVSFLYEVEDPRDAIMIEEFDLLPNSTQRGERFDIRSIKLSVVKLAPKEETP